MLYACLPIFLLSTLMVSFGMAKSPSVRRAAPRDIVASYLDADFRGARLAKDPKAPTSTSVTWDTEPDDNRFIVSRGYTLGGMRMRRGVAKLPVKFENLGEMKGFVYFPDNLTEEATFDVVRRKGSPWRIDRPILMPHVSVSTAQAYLTKKLSEVAPDSDDAKAIRRSLDAIKAQAGTSSDKKI
jgi:hypothetical protein